MSSDSPASFQIHCIQDTASSNPVTLAGSPVWWASKVATGWTSCPLPADV